MTQTVTNCSLADNNSLTRLSPAKINLFLHIIGKRADGYHNLQTVFRLLDWGDYLQFTLTDMIDTSNAAQVNTSIDQP